VPGRLCPDSQIGLTMAVPIDVATGPGGPEPTPTPAVAGKAIEGRSLGQIAWMRLRQDKVAMAGGIVVIFLILVAIFGPFLVQSPTTYHSNLIDPVYSRPYGSFGGISLAHPLGVEPVTGRDMLARIVNGARVSLIIAFLSTALAVGIGVVMGVIAGYFGGWIDSVIARLMDIFLAFPLLVFAIALVGVIPSSAFGLSGNGLRIGLLIFVIGFFAWPYMGRIIRGQTLSLRVRGRRAQHGRARAVRPVPRVAAEPGWADPGLCHAADPDQHLVRGGAVLPRGRHHPAAAELGRDGVGRGHRRLLLARPDVHDHSRAGHLHHGDGVQSVRRRTAGCP
jgi:N-terminal TM domain of oligopeptide transport permease C/Binding-protein-dependent transport system inner membrane component